MRKTTMQNGSDALDTSAASASSSLETLADAAKQLTAYFEKLTGGTGGAAGQQATPGSFGGGSGQQAGARPGGTAWATGVPAFDNATFQMSAAALFTQSSATVSPSSGQSSGSGGEGGWGSGYVPLRDAQGRFTSPTSIPSAMPAGVVPPTATSVGIPAAGFSSPPPGAPGVTAGAQSGGGQPRDAQGRFVSANGTNSGNGPAGSGFNAAQYSPFTNMPGASGLYHYGLSMAGGAISNGFEIGTQQQLSGRTNVMDTARAFGSGAGALFGGAIGFMAGGVPGAIAGAGFGSQVLGAAASYFMAPLQNRIDVRDALNVLHSTVDTTNHGGMDSRTMGNRGIRLGDMREQIGADKWGPYGVQTAEMARGYSSVSEGMLLGGINPYEKYGSRVYGPSAQEMQGHYDDLRAGRDGIRAAAGISRDAIRMLGAGREERGEAITRRAYQRYNNRGTDVLADVSRVYADMPEVGDNVVDRIGKYGPLKAMEFERLQTDDGTLPMSAQDFVGFSRDLRAGQRTRRKAGLQTRGAAQATAKSLESQLSLIDKTADGKDSMLHAETAAELREAGRSAFDEKSITSYGIPMAKLEGQLARAEAMPYSPSNVMSLSLQHIKLSDQRVSQLSSYMADRKKSGQLSEREELDLTQQIQSAKTSADMDRTRLSEGVESRLPAMLAGGGAFSSRYTTPMLAAMALQGSGNNAVRFLGAANGQHLRSQDDFYAGDKGNTSLMAHSRTQAFNSVPYQTRGGAAGQRAAAASSPAAAAASSAPGPSGRSAASQDAGEPVQASAGASGDSAASAPSSSNRRWSREDMDAYHGAPDEKSSSKAWVGQHGGQVDTDKDGRVQTYNTDGARVYGRDVQGDPLAALKVSTGYVPPKPNTYLAPKGRIGAAGNPDGPQGDFGGWDKQPIQKMIGGDSGATASGANSRMDDGAASASGPGGAGGGSGETNDLLRQIRDLLSQGGGKRGGGRADEALSSLSDMMGRTTGSNGGGFTPKFN